MSNPGFSTVAALLLATASASCARSAPIRAPFLDRFERTDLGPDYRNTGGPYRLSGGALQVRGAYNKPLWLTRALPRNARIELDARSGSADGDIKLELWGDGESSAGDRGAYLATSYVLILGGWSNSIAAIARLDEHGEDRVQRTDRPVTPNRTYHWTIVRQGDRLAWSIDGQPFLSFDDAAPLEGRRHAYLAFNNWASDCSFDNLQVIPLP
ncbi:MAG: hypothetical protein IPL40_16010 [Proteobacteria bacterium]|nr:hypothetical protein [Pseudomonadota bacterium]